MGGGAPVEDFELNALEAVVVVDLRGEGEVEFSDGKRFLAGVPPDGLVAGVAVGEPHFDVLLIGAHTLERSLVSQVAGKELDGGVSLAGRLEAIENVERLGGDFFEADVGIEIKRGL